MSTVQTTHQEPTLESELRALEHDATYKVVRTLSDKPQERTELVERGDAYYVRKTFFAWVHGQTVPSQVADMAGTRDVLQTQNPSQAREAPRDIGESGQDRLLDVEQIYRSISEIDSPFIARIIEMYRLNGSLVVISEYVHGIQLREYVLRQGHLTEPHARALTFNICDAARALHTHMGSPLVHRDINPSNIMIRYGQPVLIDFGITRAYVPEKRRDTQVLGTDGYAAPEQFGFGQTSPATDIYAIGLVYYFMVTGLEPERDVRGAVASSPVLTREQKGFILKCTQMNPSDRYPDVTVTEQELDRLPRWGETGSHQVGTTTPTVTTPTVTTPTVTTSPVTTPTVAVPSVTVPPDQDTSLLQPAEVPPFQNPPSVQPAPMSPQPEGPVPPQTPAASQTPRMKKLSNGLVVKRKSGLHRFVALNLGFFLIIGSSSVLAAPVMGAPEGTPALDIVFGWLVNYVGALGFSIPLFLFICNPFYIIDRIPQLREDRYSKMIAIQIAALVVYIIIIIIGTALGADTRIFLRRG